MSDTPRTSLAFRNGGIPELLSEAKDLERELAAAQETIQKLYKGAFEQQERIKRLVDAGDRLYWRCDSEEACEEWTAAKEDKQ